MAYSVQRMTLPDVSVIAPPNRVIADRQRLAGNAGLVAVVGGAFRRDGGQAVMMEITAQQ